MKKSVVKKRINYETKENKSYLHIGICLIHKIILILCLGIHISLEFIEWELITDFKSTEFFTFLLNRIVCQVDKFVVQISQSKLLRARSNVTVLVPISFDIPIIRCDQHVATNVEFSRFIKQWLIKVFLNNKCDILPIVVLLLWIHNIGYSLLCLCHCFKLNHIPRSSNQQKWLKRATYSFWDKNLRESNYLKSHCLDW